MKIKRHLLIRFYQCFCGRDVLFKDLGLHLKDYNFVRWSTLEMESGNVNIYNWIHYCCEQDWNFISKEDW